MTPSKIDEAVLGVAEERWQKVAMMIIRAAEKLGSELPEGDAGYELVGQRIVALVEDGRLVSQGDISRWRHSEVRLP
jgi:hypothetical protein